MSSDEVLKKVIKDIDALRTETHELNHSLWAKIDDLYNFILNNINRYEKDNLPKIIKLYTQAAILHKETFDGYKDKYKDREVVLCGAGPTLNNYIPIENAVHVALNRAFLYDKVKFDYIFACDYRAVKHIIFELLAYEEDFCEKFIGYQDYNLDLDIPEAYTRNFKCKRFYTDCFRYPDCTFTVDISSAPLGNFSSIAFPALQFILYTNPSKIYIAGCDTNANGHFSNKGLNDKQIGFYKNDQADVNNLLKKQWAEFKLFRDIYYPDTKIISINPVGLKGLFDKDIYQNRKEINANN